MTTELLSSPHLRRSAVVDRLTTSLADHRWAFQGDDGAVQRWVDDAGMGDLDIWVATESVGAVEDLLSHLGGVLVCGTADSRRLQHRQYWMPTANRPSDERGSLAIGALVDVTVGDLRVGPLLLVNEADIEIRMDSVHQGERLLRAPVLAGAARVADLAVRPLLRGRVIKGMRLHAASLEFRNLSSADLAVLRAGLLRAVGRRYASEVECWLFGLDAVVPMSDVCRVARQRLLRATVSPRSIPSTWRQRKIILPSRRVGPVGMRTKGVVIAMVGSDGSGKSTTATRLANELTRAGFTVDHQYFGMARGNLPGVGLIRRLAGGGNTDAAPAAPSTSSTGPRRVSLLHRAAAWVYVLDYGWRSFVRVRPSVRRGHVVICDRWVSDLRRHPAPDSPAARAAEWLVGAPDLFVLADAPIDEMIARKAERTFDEASAEQAGLRQVGAEMDGRRSRGNGRCTFLTIDTSARTSAPALERIAPLARAVVAAAHRGLPHHESRPHN